MKLPSRLITAITGALLILLTIAILKKNDLHSALSQFSAYGPSPVVHIVAFSLKPSLYAADVNHFSFEVLMLQKRCMHPVHHKPYIHSIRGGKDTVLSSSENGTTLVFVVEFESTEHRDYFLEQDWEYRHLREGYADRLQETMVLTFDFRDGKYM